MALYAGETVRIRASAVDPETKLPLDPLPTEAYVDFWAPGKDSRTEAPDVAHRVMLYREARNDYILNETTVTNEQPWATGKWSYRVTIVGDVFTNWEYGSFSLK